MAKAIAVVSTAYCLTGTMADGSATRAGSVAHNGYPLGTRLHVAPSPTGRRRFVVRDRIGWGTELDFWVPSCAQAIAWGRRDVAIRVGWPRLRGRVRSSRPRLTDRDPRRCPIHQRPRERLRFDPRPPATVWLVLACERNRDRHPGREQRDQ